GEAPEIAPISGARKEKPAVLRPAPDRHGGHGAAGPSAWEGERVDAPFTRPSYSLQKKKKVVRKRIGTRVKPGGDAVWAGLTPRGWGGELNSPPPYPSATACRSAPSPPRTSRAPPPLTARWQSAAVRWA